MVVFVLSSCISTLERPFFTFKNFLVPLLLENHDHRAHRSLTDILILLPHVYDGQYC